MEFTINEDTALMFSKSPRNVQDTDLRQNKPQKPNGLTR